VFNKALQIHNLQKIDRFRNKLESFIGLDKHTIQLQSPYITNYEFVMFFTVIYKFAIS